VDDDVNNMFNTVKNMIDSGNIPDNIKQIINNIDNSSKNNDNVQKSSNSSSSTLSDFLNKSNNSSSEKKENDFNIDINTILKMKSIIDSINNKDDPRANLLYSLKPYLRENKKKKLDQFVNLLNITKIADTMKKENNNA